MFKKIMVPSDGSEFAAKAEDMAIELAEKLGSTVIAVHVIDENYDTGPIVAQTKVPVREDDTPGTLQARVLEREHAFLVETLQKIAAGEIVLG